MHLAGNMKNMVRILLVDCTFEVIDLDTDRKPKEAYKPERNVISMNPEIEVRAQVTKEVNDRHRA